MFVPRGGNGQDLPSLASEERRHGRISQVTEIGRCGDSNVLGLQRGRGSVMLAPAGLFIPTAVRYGTTGWHLQAVGGRNWRRYPRGL